MGKHAYLIIAHKNGYELTSLLHMIDDSRNDIFLHMDVKNKKFDGQQVKLNVLKSHLYIVNRMNVTWGGYSQIDSEIRLLHVATDKARYQYYHLLSGSDLLIQTQNYIHTFFDNINGKELIGFKVYKKSDSYRMNIYHLFQEYLGKRGGGAFLINKFFLKLQKLIKINRNRYSSVSFKKGLNWFSITDSLARYVLQNEEWIYSTFRNTRCCDEIFLQTLVMNSRYRNFVYDLNNQDDNAAALRMIDWKRGAPYVFRKEDYNDLIESSMIFARKFDGEIDSEIITKIVNYYT